MVFKSIIGAVGMYMSLLSFTASGAPMYEYNADGDISGVSGLEFDGSVWDMTLHNGSFNELFNSIGTNAIYTTQFSFAASTALRNFTKDTLITDTSDFLGCSYTFNCLLITADSYLNGNSVKGYADEVNANSLDIVTNYSYVSSSINFTNGTFATWQMSSVPVPAAVWLFGSGLIGLIGVARRKKV